MGKPRSRERSSAVFITSQLGIKPQDLKVDAKAQEIQVDAKEKPPLAPTASFPDLPLVPPGNIINKLKSNGKLHDDHENQGLMAQAISMGNGSYRAPKSTKTDYEILIMDDPFIKGKKVAFEIYSPRPQSSTGQGGFGYIRFALNMETGEPAVLKFQDQSNVSNQEILMLKKVESYLGDVTIEHRHVIAMDLARGRELSEWIDDQADLNRFSAAQRYNLCVQAIREVIEAHRDRVIHRDIKPKNMMYDPVTGKLKVIDFGLAKKVDEKASALEVSGSSNNGTPGYRAPEILGTSKQVNYSAKSDIFALGITLAQILGIYGYNMEEEDPKYYKHWLRRETTRNPLTKNDSDKIYPFLYRMIDPDPQQRPTLNETLHFFEKMEALYDNEKTRTKQVGILDVGEYLKASEQQRFYLIQALAQCTEVWLTASAKADGKAYSVKDFLTVRAELEKNHITVGNQVAMSGENQKPSAVELACQIPLSLNRSPKFIYNYVYVCPTSLTKNDIEKLNAGQVGSLELNNKNAQIADAFKKQQELPAFQLKLHYMKIVTLLEHELTQFNTMLADERSKPKPNAERIEGIAVIKNEAEITLAALRTQYQNGSLSREAIDKQHKQYNDFIQPRINALEAKVVIEHVNGKLADEIHRIRLKHGTTDPNVRSRILELEKAIDQLKILQPDNNLKKNLESIVNNLRAELVKTDSSFSGISTIKVLIDQELKNYLAQHSELYGKLGMALQDAKAAPAAPKPKP